MAKIRCVVTFEFDSGEQSLSELQEYLEDTKGYEALEWIGDDAKFSFEEVK